MRQTQQFLREQISAAASAADAARSVELPLMFGGERDEIRYAAALPPRVVEGGVLLLPARRRAQRRQRRRARARALIPTPMRRSLPAFDDAERSVLADGIAELQDRLLRARPDAALTDEPPLARPLGRPAAAAAAGAHRRQARAGPAVADARRRAAARAGGRLPRLGSGAPGLRGDDADADRAAPRRRPTGQRGIALIAVLWLTILLTVIAQQLRVQHAQRGAVGAQRAVARAGARGGRRRGRADRVRAARGRATSPKPGPRTASRTRGRTATIAIVVTAVDESAKHRPQHRGRAAAQGPAAGRRRAGPEAAAQQLVDAIVDWRDPDELTRPNGAEAADYRAAGRKYKPAERAVRDGRASCSACSA